MNAPALVISNLSHRYGDREALKSVSFTVRTGEIFALLGPNGGGKTTLFKIVATLVRASSGTVRVFDADVLQAPERVRRCLGVVFQAPALDRQLTIVENLRCHGRLYGLRGSELDRRIADVLDLIRLQERRTDLVAALSAGLQRRVELAKALLPQPQMLVLDEPSTGLDPGARRDVWEHLVKLRRLRETTIVLTTHLMEEAAGCDRVGVMHEGQLVTIGAPAELTSEIGGDVIHILGPNLRGLAGRIAERFRQRVDVLDGRLRIERPKAHEFIPALVEAFPGEIDAVTFGKPTLEDVFLHHTGRRLE